VANKIHNDVPVLRSRYAGHCFLS